MSKKKNTLKDLDEFLKQQAATLVAPASLSEKVAKEEKKPQQKSVEKKVVKKAADKTDQERLVLCDRIIKTLEAKSHLDPEDMMLINTALYIKNGENWKEAVKEYWKGN
jgi:hypothetical protein